MSRPLIVKPLPLPPAPNALVAVDRAIADLRRGGQVVIDAGSAGLAVIMAAEAVTVDSLRQLTDRAGVEPELLVTARRAAVLGLPFKDPAVAVLTADQPLSVEQMRALADPLETQPTDGPWRLGTPAAWAAAAIALVKLARLLPAAVAAPLQQPVAGLFELTVEAILGYPGQAAHSLRRVAEARIPLVNAENSRIVAFRPADGGVEHLAIIVGKPDRDQPVLARLHSECFTGDLLGSLRCDCGDQLRGAIAALAAAGGGVLLYLAQEGRNIGLINKLRAYDLQDQGFDTLDANQQLGFDDDERIYLPAALMLRQLGIVRVRLLTNNPKKVDALARHGIDVSERVPHSFPANAHNEHYLRTKAVRSGHLF
ncbi:MAG TPA: GTP cyclohydrolase II [Rhodospirillaceae bacterium]|nr:GTP cyclohydrolase II [Rhodospirillaceae bacterium]